MRVAAAAALYFAIIFGAGFLLGPIRVLLLEPRVGTTISVLCEAPVLLIAMVMAARRVPGWVGLSSGLGALSAMGVGALALQQVADFAVGIGLRGITPGEQLHYLATPGGLIHAALLLAFAAMPALINFRRPKAR